MKYIFRNGRYANVTATLALIVALGGTSYAAVTITSKSIKNHTIKNVDLAKSSVTSGTVRNGSLLLKDFKAGQLTSGGAGGTGAQGGNGAQGNTGPTGATGPAGPTNVVSRSSDAVSVANGATGNASVSCNPGEKATGGGSSIAGGGGWSVVESFPLATSGVPTGWRVFATNNTGGTANLFAVVVCAS